MINYKDISEALKPKTIVVFFGRCNPPTPGHLVAFKAVTAIAKKNNCDYSIVVSRSQDKKKNPLTLAQKLEYLHLSFPDIKFTGASDTMRTPIEVLKHFSKTYKNLIFVAGSDRVAEYQKLFNQYNGKEYDFASIEVVSAGERDPDADGAAGWSATKLRGLAADGNLTQFRKGLMPHIREIDARRMMNDIRGGMGLETIKESIKFDTSDIREKYIAGEIFLEGTFVVGKDQRTYKIINRNSNYLTVSDDTGILTKSWLTEVHAIEVNEETIKKFEGITEMKFSSTDKIKVARIIAGVLGADSEKGSNPEQLVNLGLRSIRSKNLNAEALKLLTKMLKTADAAGIAYDKKLVPSKAIDTNESEELDEAAKDHIIMQLRKAQDVDGNHEIEFRRGKAKVDKKHIDTILKYHDKLQKPDDKRRLRIAVMQSPEHLKKIATHLGENVEFDFDDLVEAVEFSHDRYERSHGKKFRDPGHHASYMFTNKRMGDVDTNNDKEVHSFSGKFSDAKKSARAWAKQHGHSTVYMMEAAAVAPSLVKHRIGVTVSDPHHEMASKRKEQVQRFINVTHTANKQGALEVAKKFYQKKGLKVHDAWHTGEVKSSNEGVDTADYKISPTTGRKVKKEIRDKDDEKLDEGASSAEERTSRLSASRKAAESSLTAANSHPTGSKEWHQHMSNHYMHSAAAEHNRSGYTPTYSSLDKKRKEHQIAAGHGSTEMRNHKTSLGESTELEEASKTYSHLTPYGLRHREFAGKDQRLKTIETWHKSSEARNKFIDKVSEKGGFHEIESYHDPKTNEEVAIDEVLTAADPASKWIEDFVKSDNPKFDGKSKAERTKMALAAYYASQKKEGVEDEGNNIDEAQSRLDSIKAGVEQAHVQGKRYVAGSEEDQVVADAHHHELNQAGGKQVPLPAGHTLDGNDTDRRMKIKYKTEAVCDDEVECATDMEAKHDTSKIESDIPDNEISDEDIDALMADVDDWDDIIDAYDSDELALIDDETGEHVADIPEADEDHINEGEQLNEVLSRMERIKSAMRFHRTAAKRERALKLALKRHSSSKVAANRARRMAIKTLKVKLAKKPLNQLSVADKERIERIIQRRKAIVNRMAIKFVPKIKKIEMDRLSHHSYTKAA